MVLPSGVIQRPLAVIMNRTVRTIGPEATLADAAVMMRDVQVGALLVVSDGVHVGMISETDLVRKAMAAGVNPGERRVSSIMSHPVITIEIDRSAHDASDLMAEHGIRHLPVMQDGQLVGMISVRDLLRYFKNWGSL